MKTKLDVQMVLALDQLPSRLGDGGVLRVGDNALRVQELVVDGRVVYVLEVVVTGVGEVKLVHLADVLQVVGVDVADVNLVGVNGVVGLKNVQALEGNLQR